MPLPLIPIAIIFGIAGAAYKKHKDNEGKDEKSKKEEENNLLDLINNFPAFVAIMYSFSNSDGVDERELKEISKFINDFKEDIKSTYNKRFILKLKSKELVLDELINVRSTIKLSEALNYIHFNDSEISENVKNKIDELSKLIINADSHTSNEEKILAERLAKFVNQGKKSIQEIEILERKDAVLKNYFLVDKSIENEKMKKFENTVIINNDSKYFENAKYIPINNYYIINPMNNKKLISPNDIINIEKLITEEWQTIAGMLGARSIEIMNIENSSDKNIDKKETGGGIGTVYGNAKVKLDSASENSMKSNSSEYFKRTFKTGEKEDRNIVENKITWLKYNTSIEGLIDNIYSSNPPETYEIQISGEEYLSRNIQIDFEASMNLLEKIGASTKIMNIEKFSAFKKYKKIFRISF